MASNTEAVKRYQAKLDEFKIRTQKEDGQRVRAYATAQGMSVQGLFLSAVDEYMVNHPSAAQPAKEEEDYSWLFDEEEN